MSDYSVLIVGAGPTGMALATELERFGIHFLIIDKRPSYVTTSNAAGIHARTLECWHNRAWLKQIFEHALKIKGVSIQAKNQLLAQFDFTHLLHTEYPFILSIPQNETEKILDEYLTETKHPVCRDTTLTTLVSQENQVIAYIKTKSDEKIITADWVVGCDGYHSTVRDMVNIQFEGGDIEELFILADAEFEANYPKNEFQVYLHEKGILAFFTMPESTRIIAGIGHDDRFKDIIEPTAEIISEIIRERTTLQFQLNKLKWQSHFWIHERVAKKFQTGRIFIAGDAAHVHSPAGGQGMNTGIQDAYNLGWKLAYVIQEKLKPSILASYGNERHKIAKEVVSMTSKMTMLANIKNPILIKMRNYAVSFLTKLNFIQNKMVNRMSQLSLHYKNKIINQGKKIGPFTPGSKITDVLLDQDNNIFLFDILNKVNFNLFIFYKEQSDESKILEIQKRYANVMTCHFFDKKSKNILEVYPFKKFTICLIRPDQYIGYLGDHLVDFEKYLKDIFIGSIYN